MSVQRWFGLIVAGVLVFGGVGSSHAATLLNEDFNTDPGSRGWTSTDPSNVRWDSSGLLYRVRVTDQDYVARWGESALFQQVDDQSFLSFNLEVDMQPIDTAWGTYPGVAIYQQGVANPFVDSSLGLEAHWSDGGYNKFLLRGKHIPIGWSPQFDTTKWYSHTINYDAVTDTLRWDVVERDGSVPFCSNTYNAIILEGFNQFGIGYQATPPEYGRWAEIYVDNVKIDASPVPEPSTLALWSGLGAIGLLMTWRRRKRAS
jgi:hypothetical protein